MSTLPSLTHAQLIALDWGTTHLRAALLGDGGAVLEHRQSESGVMRVDGGRYDHALAALCGDWLARPDLPVIASGMIGSRQGWREAPYLACPAGIEQASSHLTRIALHTGGSLWVVPGLHGKAHSGIDDVMRGEETQIWGADLPAGALVVLPGTHSKWASVGQSGRIEGFQTFMTGELYAVLTTYSILGRLMKLGGYALEAFDAGVRLGLSDHARATHVMFAARTAGLMDQVAPEALPDYLSGILIGIEVGAAGTAPSSQNHSTAASDPITLIGAAELCERYRRALVIANRPATLAAGDVLTRGLWRIALAAGLIRMG